MLSVNRAIREMSPSSRKVLVYTFIHLEQHHPVQQALSEALDEVPVSEAIRRQATDLVYTLLRTEIRCDFILHKLFRQYEKLPALFLLLMRAAVAAMLFQEHAPVHAIVNETVNEIRRIYGRGLDRVANGFLRSVQRMGSDVHELEFYRTPKDKNRALAEFRYYSIPRSIGEMWIRQYGADGAKKLMLHSFERPSQGIRLNASRLGWKDLKKRLIEDGATPLPGKGAELPAVLFPGSGSHGKVELQKLLAEGLLSFQAAGSLLVLAELGLFEEPVPVWDACAGFGGKTVALAEQGVPLFAASDISWKRLKKLPGECRRLGVSQPLLALADASRLPALHFDGTLLLDVPCSGLGVLSRRPDIRRRTADAGGWVRVQQTILAEAARLTKKGESICYLTCTRNKEENSEAVKSFALKEGMTLAAEWETPLDWSIEGMYGARLVR